MTTIVQARRQLDRRLRHWRALPPEAAARPHAGWVRAIREALGMSSEDLARRMNVSAVAVIKLEDRERRAAATLGALERAADALDCDVVYALVPRRPLTEQVQRRAEAVARAELAPTLTSMHLEEQGLEAEQVQEVIADRVVELMNDRRLWRSDRA